MIDIKIVILIIALLIFFAYVRKCIQKNKIEYGNIQYLGQRSYQNDYFSVFQSDQKMIATVADGMITHKKGRYAAILAAEVLKENLSTSTEPYFLTIEKSVHEMQAKMSQSMFNRTLQVSFLNVVIEGNHFWWYSIGNCYLFLYRDRALTRVNQHKQKGRLKIKKRDTFLLCTDGAGLQLSEIEMINVLKKKNMPYVKCVNLSNQIRDKNIIDQDHFTIVIIENVA